MSQSSTKPPAPKTALVIGATGSIGGEVGRALLARGWRVRALNRNPEMAATAAPRLAGADWVRGDAMLPASVIPAAEGCGMIVHAANPPQYRNWEGLVMPMLDSTIAAAKAHGARIFFPGTVYNFGPDAGALVDERAPQNPLTRKGKLRVTMERRLEAAASDGVRVMVVQRILGDEYDLPSFTLRDRCKWNDHRISLLKNKLGLDIHSGFQQMLSVCDTDLHIDGPAHRIRNRTDV